MEKTKEKLQNQEKVSKKGKHKAKPTLGDIVFRVLVIVVIFFIVVIAYVSYLQSINKSSNTNNNQVQTTRTIEKTN